MLGTSISEIEVSLVSNKGFWLLLGDEELFVPYAEFPWFKKATIEEISSIAWPTPNHLYWPLIDVDYRLNPYATLTNSLCSPMPNGKSQAQPK